MKSMGSLSLHTTVVCLTLFLMVVSCSGCGKKADPDAVPTPTADAKPDKPIDPNDPKGVMEGPKPIGGTQ